MNRILPALVSCCIAVAAADLASLQSEPNLEKRAGMAMDLAKKQLDAARSSYHAGKMGEVTAALEDIGSAVELARESLKQTGKNASRSPKHFKRAEVSARGLLKRLDSLINDMSVEEREPVEKTRARVRRVQEALLIDIMGGNKRR